MGAHVDGLGPHASAGVCLGARRCEDVIAPGPHIARLAPHAERALVDGEMAHPSGQQATVRHALLHARPRGIEAVAPRVETAVDPSRGFLPRQLVRQAPSRPAPRRRPLGVSQRAIPIHHEDGPVRLQPHPTYREHKLDGLHVLPSGQLLLVGSACEDGDELACEIVVARLTSNGALDPTFGVAGAFVTPMYAREADLVRPALAVAPTVAFLCSRSRWRARCRPPWWPS